MGFDAYEQLAVDPGAVGDVARSILETPSQPGESYADTQYRSAQQAGATARIQAIKGKQWAARGVPSYQDMQGNTKPVVDDTGSPLSKLDPKHNIAYDSTGSPKKIDFDIGSGSPVLKDPFEGLETTTDPKTGHQYKIAPGLPWRWVGTDAQTAQKADFARQDANLSKASAALGRKLTLTEYDEKFHRDAINDVRSQLKQLSVADTDPVTGDPLDYDSLVAGINSQFDGQKNDKDWAGNAKEYFGMGGYKPEALKAQADLELQRAAALRAAAKGHAHAQTLDGIRQQAEAVRAQRMMIEQTKLDHETEILKAQGIDISQPKQQYGDTPEDSAQNEQIAQSAGVHPATAQAYKQAVAGQKPYAIEGGKPKPVDGRFEEGLTAAAQDGLIAPPAPEVLEAARTADAKYQELIKQAGGNQKLKAFIASGVKSYTALQAGMAASALVAPFDPELAAGGAALGGVGAVVVPMLAHGVAFLAGMFGANKALDALSEKAAEYSDDMASIQAAIKLQPGAAQLGNFAGMGPAAIKSAMNLSKAAGVAAAEATGAGGSGAKAAAGYLGKTAGTGAVGGAIFETTIRPGFDWMVDQIGGALGGEKEGVQAPTVGSVLEMAGIGALLSGLHLKIKDIGTAEATDIVKRGMQAMRDGKPLDQVLSPSENDAFMSIGEKLAKMKESGEALIKDPEKFSINVRQVLTGEDRPAGDYAKVARDAEIRRTRRQKEIRDKDTFEFQKDGQTDWEAIGNKHGITAAEAQAEYARATQIAGPVQARTTKIEGVEPMKDELPEPEAQPPASATAKPVTPNPKPAEPGTTNIGEKLGSELDKVEVTPEPPAPTEPAPAAVAKASPEIPSDIDRRIAPVMEDFTQRLADADRYIRMAKGAGSDVGIKAAQMAKDEIHEDMKQRLGTDIPEQVPQIVRDRLEGGAHEWEDGKGLREKAAPAPASPAAPQNPASSDEWKAAWSKQREIYTDENGRQRARNTVESPRTQDFKPGDRVVAFADGKAGAVSGGHRDGVTVKFDDGTSSAFNNMGGLVREADLANHLPARAKSQNQPPAPNEPKLPASERNDQSQPEGAKPAGGASEVAKTEEGKPGGEPAGQAGGKPDAETVERRKKIVGTVNVAMRGHAKELSNLGHIARAHEAELPESNKSGIALHNGKITVDAAKLDAATEQMTPEERETYINAAIGEEVLHKGFKSFVNESPANRARALKLIEDEPDAVEYLQKHYKGFDALDPEHKAAEIARVIMQGKAGVTTESTWKFIEDLIAHIKRILGNMTDATRNLIADIEARMNGRHAEPKEPVRGTGEWNEQVQKEYRKFKSRLTKAMRAKDWNAVLAEKEKFDKYFGDEVNAYPDDWARWDRAADDARTALRLNPPLVTPITKPLAEKPKAEKPAPESPKPASDLAAKTKAAFDLLSAAAPEKGIEHRGIPREHVPIFLDLAYQMIDAGIRTPRALAQHLAGTVGAEKAQRYSKAMWSQLESADPSLPPVPKEDWGAFYGGLADKTSPPSESPTATPEAPTAETGAKTEASASGETAAPKNAVELSRAVADALGRGESLDRRALAKLAESAGLSVKEVDEAAELGVVMAARRIAQNALTARGAFDRLLALYNRQPNLTAKTSTSKINQAYSTPMPLAYVASHIVGSDPKTTVQESTAGNGALLMEEEQPKNALVNELDDTRAAALRSQGFTVSQEDATQWTPDRLAQRVKVNPPFGTVMNEDGTRKEWTVDGLTTHQIDHAIALRTLKNMTDDGRAVLIIGGTQAIQPNERRAHYSTGEIGDFFKKLYTDYGVIDHFTVNGDLYSKQGAGWPVDVIVIAGRKSSPIQLPNTQPPRILNTWDELKSELTKTDEQRIQSNQYDEGKDRDELGDSLAGIRAALDSGKRTGGTGASSEPAVKTDTLGSGDGTGKPDGPQPGTDSAEGIPSTTGEREGRVGDGSAAIGDSGRGASGLTEQAKRADEEKPQFHKPYIPVSEGLSFGIETPANLAEPQRAALEAIEKKTGMPLREYVRGKLGYSAKTDLSKHFSAEQLDAIGSAIYNIENGGALILGDMAGVGKGRVVAALIEYAKRHGMTPIFVTKNPTLYSAMLADFHNIGRTINPFYTNGDLAIVHPITGEDIKTSSAGQKGALAIIERTGKLPANSDAVFTTYDQIGKDYDPAESKQSRQLAVANGGVPMPGNRVRALNALTSRGKTLLLLDESHLGAGSSIQGRRLLTMVSKEGVRAYYSSATFAKRPDAMPLYFKTNLRKAAANVEEMMAVFHNGGVVMQQVASRMLAEDGQYIRRERSFDGIPFETRINIETEERDRKLANEYTRGLRQLLDMSNRIADATKAMNQIMARIGKRLSVPTIKLEAAEFASQIHNFVAQYLFAIKAEAAAQQAIQAIKEGHSTKDGTVKKHKVIVAVQNTMEGPITDLDAEGKPLEFTSLLLRTLEGLRRIKTGGTERQGNATYLTIAREPAPQFKNSTHDDLVAQLVRVTTTIGGDGQPMQVGVVNEAVATEIFRRLANDQFLAAEAEIGQLDLGGMPLSPIDHIRQRAEAEGIRTGEITGRGTGIDVDGKTYARDPKDISKKGQLATLKQFNDSDLDLMVINASGSTGISAHADQNFKNRAPRMMIVAQPHLDINEFVQTLGRIFRSGQVEDPRYQLLQTALPAERRPAAILAKKMASLNANTTSNTDSQVSQGSKTSDIFNEYGDGVVWGYLSQHPQFTRALQYPKIVSGDNQILRPIADILDDMEEDGKFARNVASYAGLLPVEDQDVFWEDVINRYDAQIAMLDQIGENKLKAGAEDLGAETVKREQFTAGDPKGDSVFDSPSFIETVKVRPKQPPFEPAEVSDQAKAAADSKKQTVADYKKAAMEFQEKYLKAREASSLSDWSLQEPKERARLQSQYSEVWGQLNRLGATVQIKTQGGTKVGAIVGFEMDADHPLTPSKQVFIIANNTLKRTFRIPASQMGERVTDMEPELFEEQFNASREDKASRHVITGNLIAASAKLNGAGAVTLYTKSDGSVETGILLPGGFDPDRVGWTAVNVEFVAMSLLADGNELTNSAGTVRIKKDGDEYTLTLPAAKATGGKFWQDPALNRAMVGGEFAVRGGMMRAEISDFPAAFARLKDLGATVGFTPKQSGETFSAAAPEQEARTEDRLSNYSDERLAKQIPTKPVQREWMNRGVLPSTLVHQPTPREQFAFKRKLESLKKARATHSDSASSIAADMHDMVNEMVPEGVPFFRIHGDIFDVDGLGISGKASQIKTFPEIAETFSAAAPERRASERDREYLAAVKRGDMETAQRMVDAAAKKAGYETKAWHGSPNPYFTQFDASKRGQRTGANSAQLAWFASSSPTVAEGYRMSASERANAGYTGPLGNSIEKAQASYERTEAIEPFAEYDKEEGGWVGRLRAVDEWGSPYTYDSDRMVYDTEEEAMEAAEEDKAKDLAKSEKEVAVMEAKYAAALKKRLASSTVHALRLKLANPLKYDFAGGSYKDKSFTKLVEEAKENGHDGVIMERVADAYDNDEVSDVYVFFESAQAKSADPVTRDASGVIPLSKRFKPDSDSILHAAAPERKAADAVAAGAKGREETKEDRKAAQAATFATKPPGVASQIWDAIKTAGSATKRWWGEMPAYDTIDKAIGQWLGAGDSAPLKGTDIVIPGRQKAAHESRKLVETIVKQFPNVLTRQAISRYMEADGDKTTLQKWADKSKPEMKTVYERALNLNAAEKAMADTAKTFFKEKGEEAQKLGLLGNLLENYVTHFVEKAPANQRSGLMARILGDLASDTPASKLKTKFDHAIKRVFASMFDLEQEGHSLRGGGDIAGTLGAYAQAANNTVADRVFVKSLTDIMARDGRPMAVPSGAITRTDGSADSPLLIKPHTHPADTSDYRPIAHPALRKWKWIGKEGEKDVLVEGELLIHPDLYKRLKNTLGTSALNNAPIIKAVGEFQGIVKQLMLSFSPFHFVQEGTHAIGHKVNPFKVAEIDMDDPATRELVNAGLMLANWNAKAEFGEGLTASSMEKLLSHIGLGKLGKLNDTMSAFLFEKYIPGLKIAMAKEAMVRNMERFKKELASGKMTREQVAQKTAQQANDAFGEQNNLYAGNNPTRLHVERLLFLAPDFLKSRAKFFADAFRKHGGEQFNALILLAFILAVTAKLLERMLTGKNDWEKPFSVVTEDREYELRSVPGDVIAMLKNTRQFAMGRVSPIIIRTAIEAATGRDWRGQQRSAGQQVKDLAMTPLPLALRGVIDPEAPDISMKESLISSSGLRTIRHSEITKARKLGREWQKANGSEHVDEVHPPSKYVGIKNALEDGDSARAMKEYGKLLATMPKDKADTGFRSSLMKPFSGSLANEKAFVASLDADDRATYQAAMTKRGRMLAAFTRMSATTRAPADAPRAAAKAAPTRSRALTAKEFFR